MLLVSLMLSCTPGKTPPPAAAATASAEPTLLSNFPATVGVADPQLRSLLRDHWSATMGRYPTWATELGDRRFDERLYDPSEEALKIWRKRQEEWVVRASLVHKDRLSKKDLTTRDLLIDSLRSDLALEACEMHLWDVSPRGNVLVMANRLAEEPRLENPEDAASLLARYRALAPYIETETTNLRAGLASGRVGNAASIRKVVDMVQDQLAQSVKQSPLYKPAQNAPDGWSEARAWRQALAAAIEDEIRPAFQSYAAALENELLPQGRSGSEIGVHALPKGEECYAALIRSHTTLERSADELHALGLAQLKKIHAEFREIGARALETDELAAIFERLRTDPSLRFTSADEVVETAKDALGRAEAAIPEWFGRLPQAKCEVEPIPDYLAPYTTIAYYQPARPDGSRPGVYFVNTYEPQTRPRHEAEVLAFHESIPGHHLQIVIAQELGELPAFRKHGGVTAFVEGWALYIERLADEMGLYTGDLDRLGMLSFDAWRASRLVVDTGIHAKGWTRDQAEAFMRDNTPLAFNNIANEVDRYINTPGQALAYKVGQLEIRDMRDRAQAELGDDFELAAFHDQILGAGPLPLPMLAERIERWIGRIASPSDSDTANESSPPPEEGSE